MSKPSDWHLCRECGQELEITDVDDCTISVSCCSCNESYQVEPDGLGYGGMEWAEAMERQQMAESEATLDKSECEFEPFIYK